MQRPYEEAAQGGIMNQAKRILIPAIVLLTSLPVPSSAQPPAEDPLPLHLTAFAVNMSGVGRANAGTIEMTIERWSTDAEREKLRDTLVERGPDKLLDTLQDIKPRTGFVRTPNSIGWDLYYAREIVNSDNSRRIILATNRPMSFLELRNAGRSTEYDFTIIEIRLGPDGKGVGKYAQAVKVSYNKETKTVELENYGQEPIRLTEVTLAKPKEKKK
jgi:hypothetical protein